MGAIIKSLMERENQHRNLQLVKENVGLDVTESFSLSTALQAIIGEAHGEKIEAFLQSADKADLPFVNVAALKKFKFTKAQALKVVACIQFALRLNKLDDVKVSTIRNPQDVFNIVGDDMQFLSQEHFMVLGLNTKNEVILKKTVFIGSANTTIVHPREIFRSLLAKGCVSFIAVHNHPSNSPKISPEDVGVTERLIEAGKLVGIEILDHVVVAGTKFTSLKEEGYM